ncbi:hypothetical protein N8703_04065 [Verrucomicrobia bacterium]|jgi:hypothetical protein|nr:hypothetical protein [Verrucomicrobiota bacterium]
MTLDEQQRFDSPWIWGPVIIFAVIFCFFIGRAALGNFSASTPNPTLGWILSITLFIPVIVAVLLFKASLIVKVNKDELRFRLKPFHLKEQVIGMSNIQSAEIVSFRPVRDYGGYGIRYAKGAKAYIVSGGKGVKIKCKDDRTFVFGSQKPDRLAAAINQNITP